MPAVTPSASEQRFRSELRDWLAGALPSGWGSEHKVSSDLAERLAAGRAWHRTLHEGGWSGLGWAEEYGGQPATATEQLAFNEETARARAPEPADIFGLHILGPTLLSIGTEEHRRRFLPPIVRGEAMWCETFSEPAAGSDMASVQTLARREGDELVVTGRKRWNSLAQFADWTMLLCRTGPPDSRGHGITFVLVDLATPGIRVEPMGMLTGDARENEVFFEDARVPVDNVVGEIDGGWSVAMTAMTIQRAIAGAVLAPRLRMLVDDLVQLARDTRRGGRPAIEDPLVRQRLAQARIEVDALRLGGERALAATATGRPPGAEVSTAKLTWSETEQRIQRSALDLLGLAGQLTREDPEAIADGYWSHYFLWSHALTIHSGTSEIQRNILAKRVLGLPGAR